MSDKRIKTYSMWSAQAITQNNSDSFIFELDEYLPEGFLGIYFQVTGAGNVNIDATVTADGTNFVTPSAWTTEGALSAAFDATSGAGSDGKDYIDVTKALATFCKQIKFTVTEQNAGAVAVTATLVVQ